jgi:hypothetical protein
MILILRQTKACTHYPDSGELTVCTNNGTRGQSIVRLKLPVLTKLKRKQVLIYTTVTVSMLALSVIYRGWEPLLDQTKDVTKKLVFVASPLRLKSKRKYCLAQNQDNVYRL